jgi:hypothetical protein
VQRLVDSGDTTMDVKQSAATCMQSVVRSTNPKSREETGKFVHRSKDPLTSIDPKE